MSTKVSGECIKLMGRGLGDCVGDDDISGSSRTEEDGNKSGPCLGCDMFSCRVVTSCPCFLRTHFGRSSLSIFPHDERVLMITTPPKRPRKKGKTFPNCMTTTTTCCRLSCCFGPQKETWKFQQNASTRFSQSCCFVESSYTPEEYAIVSFAAW